MFSLTISSFFFFFNDTATTEIYTLSLHDALPIYGGAIVLERQDRERPGGQEMLLRAPTMIALVRHIGDDRSEEHTSELQSRSDLVCRLLLEKKKQQNSVPIHKMLTQ